jgi:ribosome-binding protein aMBF1 (putative translation factor)
MDQPAGVMTMATLIESTADTLIKPPGNAKATAVTRNSSNVCVGSRLRVRRASRGISEKELSEKLGIDPDDVNAYEEGIQRVSANLLLRIAKLLDVRPDYFFQGYTAEELSACLETPL